MFMDGTANGSAGPRSRKLILFALPSDVNSTAMAISEYTASETVILATACMACPLYCVVRSPGWSFKDARYLTRVLEYDIGKLIGYSYVCTGSHLLSHSLAFIIVSRDHITVNRERGETTLRTIFYLYITISIMSHHV